MEQSKTFHGISTVSHHAGVKEISLQSIQHQIALCRRKQQHRQGFVSINIANSNVKGYRIQKDCLLKEIQSQQAQNLRRVGFKITADDERARDDYSAADRQQAAENRVSGAALSHRSHNKHRLVQGVLVEN